MSRAKILARPVNAMLVLLLIAAWGPVAGSVPSKGDARGLAGSERKSSEFNYLESAVIDPDSGRVDLFGLENPQGPDDSIPYRQVLSEALHQPGPQFSLESDFSGFTRDSIQGKSMNGLLFTPEGKLTGFGRATLEVLHVPVGANAGQAEYVGAVLRQAGFSLAADLLQAAPPGRGFDSSVLKSWIDVLFLNADYETFVLARQNEAPGAHQASDAFYTRLVLGLGEALADPAGKPQGAYSTTRAAGYAPDLALKEAIQRFLGEYDGLMVRAVTVLLERHGLPAVVYPPEKLAAAFGTTPVSRPRFVNLDDSTQLARILFEGDYALKSVPFNSALVDVPGYASFPRWAETYMDLSDLGQARDTRYWITVESVEIRESPDGNAATLGDVKLRVESRTKESGESWSDERVDPTTKAYADLLTETFGAIALEVPALYNLREGAKVVALANWLRGKAKNIDVEEPSEPWKAPPEVPGYLAMMPYQREGRVIWGIWPSGGVDFDFGSRIVVRKDPDVSAESVRSASTSAEWPLTEEAWRRLLRPADRDLLQTPRTNILGRRIEATGEEVKRTRALYIDSETAADTQKLADEFFRRTVKLQGWTLRDAADALRRSAESLQEIDRAIAGSSEPLRGDSLRALGKPTPPPGSATDLVSDTREVVAEVATAAPDSVRSFDPALFTALDGVESGGAFAHVTAAVDSWDDAFRQLQGSAPDLFDALGRETQALERFVRSAGDGRNGLYLYRLRQRAVRELLPDHDDSVALRTALEGVLRWQTAEIRDSRRQLEQLAG